MKVKTSELTGAALDWAVAKCEYPEQSINTALGFPYLVFGRFKPSTDWAQGGPIIEKMHGYCMEYHPELPEDERFYCSTPSVAEVWHNHPVSEMGGTTLVATMRCYVASKLGDEVDVPNELVK